MHFYHHHHHYYHCYYFFYYYYYHFFLGGCRFKKTFQKTTVVKDNVKVNILFFSFFFCLKCVLCFLALVLLKT